MAQTVSDIQQIARNRYNAVNDDFYNDTFLNELIFAAQAILAKEGWVIEKTLTNTSVSGTRILAYPDNTLAIKEIRYDSDKLDKLTLSQDPLNSSNLPTGRPTAYALWDDQIILYPTPDTSDLSIQIRTYSYPSVIATNSTPIEVPQEYRQDLVEYIIAIMAEKDQNLAISDRALNNWRLAVERAKQQRKRRLRGDKPARMKDVYFGGDTTRNTGEDILRYGYRF